MMQAPRDHGGGLDAAIAQYGGTRADWLDLSTGINLCPYPLPMLPDDCWHHLPDTNRQDALLQAARQFWQVPQGVDILASSGVSQLIAAIPHLMSRSSVNIPAPTYNEHAAAFRAADWRESTQADVMVLVHPNNPDGKLHTLTSAQTDRYDLVILDESFCDTCPENSLIDLTRRPNVVVLKGLGKFWGLAGLRLGFAIGQPAIIQKLRDLTGPWAVSGPAQVIGAAALSDEGWASKTRTKLNADARKMDQLASGAGLIPVGGTSLFRLYETPNAKICQGALANHHVWSRIFPYSKTWIRLGLPGTTAQWTHFQTALRGMS